MERHDLERLRRSIAMLDTGRPALNREDALNVLEELAALQRDRADLRTQLQKALGEASR